MTKNIPLLAFSGAIASGKTTTAHHVAASLYGGDYQMLSFATPLKEEVDMLMELHTYHPDKFTRYLGSVQGVVEHNPPVAPEVLQRFCDVVDDSGLSGDPLRRLMLQQWGTQVRRAADPDCWVEILMDKVTHYHSQGVPVVIDDVRFRNEVEALLDTGAVLIRLEVSPEVQLQRLNTVRGIHHSAAVLEHNSEKELADCDRFSLVIDNDDPQKSEQEIVDYLLTL